VLYPSPEVMLLVLCATLAGAEDFVEFWLWGPSRAVACRSAAVWDHSPAVLAAASIGQARASSQPKGYLCFN
jgi:hypothetical protein